VTGDGDDHDLFPYPHGDVVGVFVDEAAVGIARERLEQAGFGPEQYEVLHGEAGLARIDTTGDRHGWMGRMFRRLQNAVTDEGEHARQYAEYLSEGHYIVGVAVGDDKAAKRRAAEAMRGGDAEFLVYYATNYIEDLGANG
jgi:hypothetical protein